MSIFDNNTKNNTDKGVSEDTKVNTTSTTKEDTKSNTVSDTKKTTKRKTKLDTFISDLKNIKRDTKVQVSYKLEKNIIDKIKEISEETGVSNTEIVEEALKRILF